ncbi:hypothetical protein [Paenibacillus humicola]|uniref:hypothetical protein n=1 Tax=Paenibacillus humicola TaxID=3110540 RepID=UPI00237BA0C2|nr:hypothetical protein [Paenibacillus humicola]
MPQKEVRLAVPDRDGQLSLMFARGGPRAGSGRKAIGETKKISLTLPGETWEAIERQCAALGCSKSELLRTLIHAGMANGERG